MTSTNSWLRFELNVLLMAVGVLVLAALMHPSTETLTLWGFELPPMCTWRRLTGMNCPGCGLTRSFVFLAHGRLMEAFSMNWFGPPMFAVVAGQLPYRLLRLWRLRVPPIP